MKKIIIGLLILFIGGQRKYLKKHKKQKTKYEDNINQYEYTVENEIASENRSIGLESFEMDEIQAIDNAELILDKVELNAEMIGSEETIDKSYSEWTNYSKEIDWSILEEDAIEDNDIKIIDYGNKSGSQVNDVVLVILSIFIPPLAVYLYEDSITNNFWLDLILTLFFWVPGIIFALLVIFGGLSL